MTSKNTPRYRAPKGRSRKGKGFFKSLGSKLDSLWGSLTGKANLPRHGSQRPQPPVPAEIFDDLQIAIAKAQPGVETSNPPVEVPGEARRRSHSKIRQKKQKTLNSLVSSESKSLSQEDTPSALSSANEAENTLQEAAANTTNEVVSSQPAAKLPSAAREGSLRARAQRREPRPRLVDETENLPLETKASPLEQVGGKTRKLRMSSEGEPEAPRRKARLVLANSGDKDAQKFSPAADSSAYSSGASTQDSANIKAERISGSGKQERKNNIALADSKGTESLSEPIVKRSLSYSKAKKDSSSFTDFAPTKKERPKAPISDLGLADSPQPPEDLRTTAPSQAETKARNVRRLKTKKPRPQEPSSSSAQREVAESFNAAPEPIFESQIAPKTDLSSKAQSQSTSAFQPLKAFGGKLTRRRLSMFLAGGLVLVVALVFGVHATYEHFHAEDIVVAKVSYQGSNKVRIAPLEPGLYEMLAREHDEAVKTETVIAEGWSLSQALQKVGVRSNKEASAIIETLTGEDGISLVKAGAHIEAFWTNPEHDELDRLVYHPVSSGAPLVLKPKNDGSYWMFSMASPPITLNFAKEAMVESSLWQAANSAKIDQKTTERITEILAAEIDFITDIKKGDSFQVLYRRDFQDGRPLNSSQPIVDMIKMTNQGRDHEFYRFVNAKGEVGYFDPKGHSNRKTFFMSPLQYTRISSKFTMTRRHPIYKVVRPHQGVDYAAPSGTPVISIADGTVIFCGWSGGYGRLVTIKHDDTYTTMYAHLSKFAPGLKKGSVVKQGQLIGNVGATGVATGPHLDFRIKKNGVFIDPLPELAKQQGRMLDDATDTAAFTKVVTRTRNRMTHLLNSQN